MDTNRIDPIARRAGASVEQTPFRGLTPAVDFPDAPGGAGCFLRLDTFFGVVAQSPEDGDRWRIAASVSQVCPQSARNRLIWLLWRGTRWNRDDRAFLRRAKAGIRLIRRTHGNELIVHGTRYRVVRADGYVRLDAPGHGEPAVESHESVTRSVGPGGEPGVGLDYPYFLDPARLTAPGDRQRVDSAYPDAFFLPWAWQAVHRTGDGWIPIPPRMPTLRAAYWDFAPNPSVAEAERRLPVGHPVRAAYDKAIPILTAAGRTFPAVKFGYAHVISPIRRLLRWGPDGPEPPRPSDIDVTPLRPKLRG